MKRNIKKVTVLGSGIMGSRIACHFANIGTEVLLLDIAPRELNEEEKKKGLALDSSLVKTLTGRDSISARFLHENEFQFKPKFKLILNSNYLPVINDKTVFSSNRVKVIPFEYKKVLEELKLLELQKKLQLAEEDPSRHE